MSARLDKAVARLARLSRGDMTKLETMMANSEVRIADLDAEARKLRGSNDARARACESYARVERAFLALVRAALADGGAS